MIQRRNLAREAQEPVAQSCKRSAARLCGEGGGAAFAGPTALAERRQDRATGGSPRSRHRGGAKIASLGNRQDHAPPGAVQRWWHSLASAAPQGCVARVGGAAFAAPTALAERRQDRATGGGAKIVPPRSARIAPPGRRQDRVTGVSPGLRCRVSACVSWSACNNAGGSALYRVNAKPDVGPADPAERNTP
jgi:hypothetical protein